MKNTIKSLVAIGALATVGSAHAAIIATFDVTNNAVLVSSLVTGSVHETGTATLSDSGVLTIDKSGTTTTNPGGSFTVASEIVYQGTISGNTYTVNSGTLTYTQCLSSSCSVAIGSPQTLTATPTSGDGGGLPAESLDIVAGGVLHMSFHQYGGAVVANHTMTLTPTTTPPAVPVPAAAWLFGSSLLGLTGAARRRQAA